MTIDQRLHHAARELRAVPIEVPELGRLHPQRRWRRVPALVAPVLFAVGGLVAVTGALGSGAQGHHDAVERDFAVGSDVAATTTDRGPIVPRSVGPIGGELIVPSNDSAGEPHAAASARTEHELIANLVRRGDADERATRPSGRVAAETDVPGGPI